MNAFWNSYVQIMQKHNLFSTYFQVTQWQVYEINEAELLH